MHRSAAAPRRRGPLAVLTAVSLFAVTLALPTAAAAVEVPEVELEILRVSSAFEGREFGDVGAYEKITARMTGLVDPDLRGNAVITDIRNAPRNEDGLVEYSADVQILKPIDMSRGSGKLMYEVVNRGNQGILSAFNDGGGGNDPTTAAHAGSGLLMERGYTLVASGWEAEPGLSAGGNRLTADFPVARNADGSSIVERTVFEDAFFNSTRTDISLIYAAATTDEAQTTLYVRNASSGPRSERRELPDDAWQYVGERTVRVDRAHPSLAGYDAGAAYEVYYPAKDPVVLGLGFAATRDLISFLRYDTTEDNPLAGEIDHVLAHGNSQSGRYLKGFVHWGFNEDLAGRQVFDGINANITGAHSIALNDRFGDSGATGRLYLRHYIAKMEFPFTYGVRTDPVTGKTDGILARCQESGTCPFVLHTDSGNEAYLKAASLVTTDGQGNDIELPDNVRVFSFASTQHGPSSSPAPTGVCQQLSNPNDWAPPLRALFVALDEWATAGVEPPASRYPKVSDGTYVPTLPRSTLGFPEIPGVLYNGWINTVEVVDRENEPWTAVPGTGYVVLAPKTDADGNDLAGVRTVELQVPLGTYTGWAVNRAGFAEGEDCQLAGQFIPFAETRAERLASGDPRLSIEERYPLHGVYVSRVVLAADEAVREGLLLPEDAEAAVARAAASDIGRPARLSTLLTGYRADGTISSRTTASLQDRLDRAIAAADEGSEKSAISHLQQFRARVQNQVRGDAADHAARQELLAAADLALAALRDLDSDEDAAQR